MLPDVFPLLAFFSQYKRAASGITREQRLDIYRYNASAAAPAAEVTAAPPSTKHVGLYS